MNLGLLDGCKCLYIGGFACLSSTISFLKQPLYINDQTTSATPIIEYRRIPIFRSCLEGRGTSPLFVFQKMLSYLSGFSNQSKISVCARTFTHGICNNRNFLFFLHILFHMEIDTLNICIPSLSKILVQQQKPFVFIVTPRTYQDHHQQLQKLKSKIKKR